MADPIIGAIYRRKFGRRSKMTVTTIDTSAGIIHGASHDDGKPCGYIVDLFQKDFALDEFPPKHQQMNDFHGLKIGSEYVNTDGSLRVTITGYDSKLVYCDGDGGMSIVGPFDYNDFINRFTPITTYTKMQFAKDVAEVLAKHNVYITPMYNDDAGFSIYEIGGQLSMDFDELQGLVALVGTSSNA